jgi:hypothetical protein
MFVKSCYVFMIDKLLAECDKRAVGERGTATNGRKNPQAGWPWPATSRASASGGTGGE